MSPPAVRRSSATGYPSRFDSERASIALGDASCVEFFLSFDFYFCFSFLLGLLLIAFVFFFPGSIQCSHNARTGSLVFMLWYLFSFQVLSKATSLSLCSLFTPDLGGRKLKNIPDSSASASFFFHMQKITLYHYSSEPSSSASLYTDICIILLYPPPRVLFLRLTIFTLSLSFFHLGVWIILSFCFLLANKWTKARGRWRTYRRIVIGRLKRVWFLLLCLC